MKIDFYKNEIPAPATQFEQKVIRFLDEWHSGSATVKVQTSGSTGTPKKFEIEKERMRHSARMTCDFLNLKEGNSALLCLPIEYISGKMMIVRAIERKLTLSLAPPTAQPLAKLTANIDFCAMTPLQVENSLGQLHLIRKLIIGGAAVSENLKEKIHATLAGSENRIYETYGMSETLSHIALKEIYPSPAVAFTTLKNIEISTDRRGCLQIFAPELNGQLLITNDLVELTSPSSFRYIGRIDNVINSAGLKLFPELLESLVKKKIPNEVAFLGLSDELLGKKLVLAVEGAEDAALKEVLHRIPYPTKNHAPKQIIFLDDFPRTPNGKINRAALTALISNEKL